MTPVMIDESIPHSATLSIMCGTDSNVMMTIALAVAHHDWGAEGVRFTNAISSVWPGSSEILS